MTTRSRLFSCLVALAAVLAVAAGCATSGEGATNSGCTDPQISCGGACVDPTTDGQNCGACGNVCPAGQGCTSGACGACVAPQTACGTACVVLGTDNKNCGKCGASCGANQVCSNGTCSTMCGPGLTTCGGSTHVDAGADSAAADATTDATSDAASDATTTDAAPMDASPDSGGATDAGGGPIYCSDTTKDPMNCGGCGLSCGPGHACKMSQCQLDCPMGKHACNGSNLCIPDGTCCTNADCMVTGQKCSGPGDMCKCPSGQKVCTANNACIDSAACCTNADCAGITGSSCSMPGGMCTCPTGKKACTGAGACIATTDCCTNADCTAFGQTCTGVGPGMGGACACPTGQKLCVASNSCIPNASCCTTGDCPPTSQVATTTCGGGMCSVATCNPGWVDVDRAYSNGCECQDSGNATTCASPTALGNVAVGGTVSKTGNLPNAGQENWFQVSFAGQGTTSYHPKVTLSTNPGNQYVFDVAPGCGGTPACGIGGGGGVTTWEVTSGGDPNGQGINTSTYAPTPPVGTNGTIWIRVYRASGNPTCDSYVLTVTD